MNRLQKEFYIFICIVIFSYVTDIATSDGIYKKCIHSHVFHTDLFFHHLVNIFSQFGWLSSNIYVLYFYLTVPLIVLIHWKTNENRCIWTQRTNKMCDIPEGYFRDWMGLIGIKKQTWYDTFHISLLVVGWCIALWKIKNIA
jgi:hypothetical protein